MGVKRFFPFLSWGDTLTMHAVRDDIIAGVTVALVLIPQSIAYAQLAGLPAQFGLYAALLPPVIASLFGSSRYLATGPVAVVSLITASALSPIPIINSSELIQYAIVLAFLVGFIQILIGGMKLGIIVNFISHPVIIGFSNAAAIIIATSQLPKIFGVHVDTYEHHYETLYHFLLAATKEIHLPSLLVAIYAFFAIIILKKVNPKIPGILITVVITTYFSFTTGFEQKTVIAIENINSPQILAAIGKFNGYGSLVKQKTEEKSELMKKKQNLRAETGASQLTVLDNDLALQRTGFELEEAKKELEIYQDRLRGTQFAARTEDGVLFLTPIEENAFNFASTKTIWHMKVGEDPLNLSAITIVSGGSVVGKVPQGLPSFQPPSFDFNVIPQLFNSAIIIALLGFMESISIAKSLASRTDGKIDPNQELVGQGLANFTGSFFQGYPVAGSFSRTAVNYQAGAKSGLSSVFASGFVLITLLFLTPLLYHLPQSVLAVIIIVSVMGLIKFDKVAIAWRAHKSDGVIAIVTFICTLFFAPDLDKGILIGVLLSTGYYIYTRAYPRIVTLALDKEGTWHDSQLFDLATCKHILIIRFDGSLFFANAAYLETKVMTMVTKHPRLVSRVVLVSNGINYIDYTGIETLETIMENLREIKKDLLLVNVKSHILEKIEHTGLVEKLGKKNICKNEKEAIKVVYNISHLHYEERPCPLYKYKP